MSERFLSRPSPRYDGDTRPVVLARMRWTGELRVCL